jgi:L-threonylcarbamoyladenylate synthase
MKTRVIKIDSPAQASAAAREAAEALLAGGLVGFPTETVYGVAALAAQGGALERLRELKDRPGRPFSVHMGSPVETGRYVGKMPPPASLLIARAWPGPVTVLLKVGGALAEAELQRQGLYAVLCHDDVIGLRCPDSAVTSEMLLAAGGPVVATSANRVGGPSPRSADDAMEQLGGRFDLLLDAGPTRHGQDSTIVDFSAGTWKIVRAGVLGERQARDLSATRLLFVCTGNTCRSPIAAGLATTMLAERLGCKPEELEGMGVEVVSAGVLGMDGSPATPEAVRAARRFGADISRHRSRRLTNDLIRRADVVYCMTEGHVRETRLLSPGSVSKIRRLDESANIEDPVGMAEEDYVRTARHIRQSLEKALDSSPWEAALPGGRHK